MAIRGLYRKAKQEVDEEYDQISKLGFKPVANADGKTYSWVNDKGQIYRGKLNPTPGIDADSGFLKRHLTREARQDRLMSEKVTAGLYKDGPAPAPAAGGPVAGTTNTTTTTPEKKKEDETPAQRTKEEVEAAAKDMPQQIKYPKVGWDSPDMASRDIKLPGLQKSNIATQQSGPREYTSVLDLEHPDPRFPYVYATEEQAKQIHPSRLGRVWGKPWSGKSQSDVYNWRQSIVNTPLGLEQVTPKIPDEIVDSVTGKKLQLINNPFFDSGTYDPLNSSEGSQAYEHSQRGIFGNRDVNIKNYGGTPVLDENGQPTYATNPTTGTKGRQIYKGGKDYIKVEQSMSDKVANALAILQGLITPAGTTYLVPGTGAAIEGGAAGTKAITAGQKAIEGVKEAPKALKAAEAATEGAKAAKGASQGQAAIESAPVRLELPAWRGSRPAVNELAPGPSAIPMNPGNPQVTQQLLPFRDAAGRYFPVRKKCGGKLRSKSKPSMKGKGK
jgi:hypothetical protein